MVGFLVQPLSISNKEELGCNSSVFDKFITLSSNFTEKNIRVDEEGYYLLEQTMEFIKQQELEPFINFSYSVSYENSTINWASRWDVYLYSSGGEVH